MSSAKARLLYGGWSPSEAERRGMRRRFMAGTWDDSAGRHLDWYTGPYIYAHADLAPGARVLDVGAGQSPHPAADVILDKFLDDNTHRPARAEFDTEHEIVVAQSDGEDVVVLWARPVVGGDVIALPFKDKAFDFVIAKDVLEHVEDIEAACRELSRVARGGYVEMPKLQSEILFPQGDIHRWVVREETGGLRVYSLKNFVSPWGCILHELIAKDDAASLAWCECRHYFHLCLLWTDQLDMRVAGHVVDICC